MHLQIDAPILSTPHSCVIGLPLSLSPSPTVRIAKDPPDPLAMEFLSTSLLDEAPISLTSFSY